jgi:hypothetical protein
MIALHAAVVEERRQRERWALALGRLQFDRRAGTEIVWDGGTAGLGLVHKQGALLAVGSPLFPPCEGGKHERHSMLNEVS